MLLPFPPPLSPVVFQMLLPQTADNYILHVGVAFALAIRSTRGGTIAASIPPARAARPLRSASDSQPTSTPPSTFWAKARRQLLRFKNSDPPMSWAEVLVDLQWDLGTGMLGVAFLGERQLRHAGAGSTGKLCTQLVGPKHACT